MEEGLRLKRERQRGLWSFLDGSVVKNLLANAEDAGDVGSIPRLGRSPGEGNGNPFQYSCLENPMNRGAWWATVHRIAESDMTEHACKRHLGLLVTQERDCKELHMHSGRGRSKAPSVDDNVLQRASPRGSPSGCMAE